MRLKAAIKGNLRQDLRKEYRTTEKAVTRGVKSAGDGLKLELRRQLQSAGLGRKLAKTWRGQSYPRAGDSAGAAALVFSKAPDIIDAHAKGATIRANGGRWLAIPTEAAGRGRGGRRPTPATFRLPLRFVPRTSRLALLVAEGVRVGKTGRVSAVKGGLRTKTGRLKKGVVRMVPIFILVRQVKLRKRLDVEKVHKKWGDRMVGLIDRAFDELDGSGG